MTKLSTYTVPPEINYIAAFLTFGCQLKCSYCINKQGGFKPRHHMNATDWVTGLSRFKTRPDLPITIQGGEPTVYSGFYSVVNGIPSSIPLDLLTNAQFDVERFISKIHPSRFGRVAPYAPIRISYHRETMNHIKTINTVARLQGLGYKVGIWAVDVPENRAHNEMVKKVCESCGIDFRWKEYLAPGHGTYQHPEACFSNRYRTVNCKTTEILIDPSGHFFRCHSDLYSNINPIGHILDTKMPDFTAWRKCEMFGACSPCDQKVKFDRFQKHGHSSVKFEFTQDTFLTNPT